MNIVFLTAYYGREDSIILAAETILPQLNEGDLWLIVLDNIALELPFECDSRVRILKYQGNRGAGNARNHGLRYLERSSISYPFALWPIDGDDQLKTEAVRKVRETIQDTDEKILTFAYEIVTPFARRTKDLPTGAFDVTDQLYNYSTPCGCTIVKVIDRSFFAKVKFGFRRRANDQLFFLSACRLYGRGLFCSDIILEYSVGFHETLSSNKLKMPYYKFLALRDFGLNYPVTLYFFLFYLYRSLVKYIKLGFTR